MSVVYAGKSLLAQSFNNQRFHALVADQVRDSAAKSRANRSHPRIEDRAPGIDDHVVGNKRVKRNAKDGAVNERDEKHGPWAAKRGDNGHNPCFVEHKPVLKNVHSNR
jgi:hypothetical protein